MAIDQAILESEYPGPTLRFYGWSAPTLSLGYFQKLADRERHKESAELTLVRRSTGGGAIVHDRELTYSVVLPCQSQRELFQSASNLGAILELYESVHQSVIDTLGEFGVHATLHKDSLASENSNILLSEPEPFLCFQRRSEWDLTVSGYKVVGSAQRRVRGKILQHGSLLLGASCFAPQLPGVSEFDRVQLATEKMAPEKVAAHLMKKLGTKLGVHWSAETLSSEEQELSKVIRKSRFADPTWTARH